MWANRVQPANSKGGNWWQSPLCGAHTDRHFRESRVMRKPHPANRVQPANSKGGNWWQSPFCGAPSSLRVPMYGLWLKLKAAGKSGRQAGQRDLKGGSEIGDWVMDHEKWLEQHDRMIADMNHTLRRAIRLGVQDARRQR